MFRTSVSHLLILALLFISMEGAMDSVAGVHPHGDEYGHHISRDAGALTTLIEPTASNSNTGSLIDDKSDGEHCQHCCHGHASSISTQHDSNISDHPSRPPFHFFQAQLLSLAQAPPTRPPNV